MVASRKNGKNGSYGNGNNSDFGNLIRTGGLDSERIPEGVIIGPSTLYVPLDLIDDAPYNPKNPAKPHLERDNPAGKHVQELARDMGENGQRVPARVHKQKNGRYLMSNGHCRKSAAKLLGWKHLWVIASDDDPTEAYRTENNICKPHSSHEKLYAFLKNPNAVPVYSRNAYRAMVLRLGKKLVEEMVFNNYTWLTYKQALKVVEYCGVEDKDDRFLKKVVQWMMRHKMTKELRQAMDIKMNPVKVYQAIDDNKKLCVCD